MARHDGWPVNLMTNRTCEQVMSVSAPNPRRFSWLLAISMSFAIAAMAARLPGQPPVAFEKSAQPVLQQHCVKCHGAQPKVAGLDLGSAASAIKGGNSGAAIVPGSAAKSMLYKRIA